MGEVTVIGLDLAKHVFQVHGADAAGEVVIRKQLRRAQVLEFFGRQPRCLVAMEACSSAHFWGRELTGKRVSRLNPEHEWIRKDAPELRIIDEETWAAVQALKSRFTGWAGNKRQTKKRLLTGLVTCACCGGTMNIARRDRYYCNTRIVKGTCEARHGIAVADLEARVLGGLQRLLVGNEALLQAFADEFRAELERLQGERRKDEAKLRRELAETERGIKRCLDFILSGDGAPASVRTKLQDLEASKDRLEAEFASLHAALPAKVEIHPNLPELYRRRVTALAELLEDEATQPQAMEAICGLVERVEVGPPEAEREPCTVTLVGTLAALLTFVSEQQAAASSKGAKQNGRPFQDGRSVARCTASSGTFFLVAREGYNEERTTNILRLVV